MTEAEYPSLTSGTITPMVKLRSLEIASMGPLQIIEQCEDLQDYFEDGKEIVRVKTLQLNFRRIGDDDNIKAQQVKFEGYKWIYATTDPLPPQAQTEDFPDWCVERWAPLRPLQTWVAAVAKEAAGY